MSDYAIGLLTLAVVIWNTLLTRNMLDELRRQRRVSNMPTFTAEICTAGEVRVLGLTNVGKGIAFNIAVDDVTVQFPNSAPQVIKFESATKAGPGERVFLKSNYDQEPLLGDFWRENDLMFLDSVAHSNSLIVIRAEDVEGLRYYQRTTLGRDGYQHGVAVYLET